MVSLKELIKKKEKLMKEKAIQDEKAKLKSEIFELKHGGKVRILKNIGKTIAKGAVKAGQGFANYAEKYNERSSSQSKEKSSNSSKTKSQKPKSKVVTRITYQPSPYGPGYPPIPVRTRRVVKVISKTKKVKKRRATSQGNYYNSSIF